MTLCELLEQNVAECIVDLIYGTLDIYTFNGFSYMYQYSQKKVFGVFNFLHILFINFGKRKCIYCIFGLEELSKYKETDISFVIYWHLRNVF